MKTLLMPKTENRRSNKGLIAVQSLLILGLLILTSAGVSAETRIAMETTDTSHVTEIRIRPGVGVLVEEMNFSATVPDASRASGFATLFDCTVTPTTGMICAIAPDSNTDLVEMKITTGRARFTHEILFQINCGFGSSPTFTTPSYFAIVNPPVIIPGPGPSGLGTSPTPVVIPGARPIGISTSPNVVIGPTETDCAPRP